MQDRMLHNVLKNIEKTKICSVEIIDHDYYKALDKVGLISIDWETKITDLGKSVMEMLSNKFEKW